MCIKSKQIVLPPTPATSIGSSPPGGQMYAAFADTDETISNCCIDRAK